MDQDRVVAEVAKRHGVLLDRDDPILTISTMLEMHEQDRQERDAKIAQRDADLLAALSRVLERAEKDASGQLAATAAADLPAAIDRLVLEHLRWIVVLVALGAVLIGVLGFGAGWFWRSSKIVDSVNISNCSLAPQAAGEDAYQCTFWVRRPTLGRH
jgi:hypothetical protein